MWKFEYQPDLHQTYIYQRVYGKEEYQRAAVILHGLDVEFIRFEHLLFYPHEIPDMIAQYESWRQHHPKYFNKEYDK